MDAKKLNGFLEEAFASHLRIDAEKDQLKSIKEKMVDELQIDKKLAGKLIHYYCKGNLDEDKHLVDEVSQVLTKRA